MNKKEIIKYMIDINKIIKSEDVKEKIKFLCNYSSNTDIDEYIQDFIVNEIINGKVPGYEFITNEDKAWDIVEGLCPCMEAAFTIYYDNYNKEMIAGTITRGSHSGCVTAYSSLPLKEGTDLYEEWDNDQEMFDSSQINWTNFDKIFKIHSHPTGMLSPSLSDLLCHEYESFGICGNLNDTYRFKSYTLKGKINAKDIVKYDNYSSSYLFTPKEEWLMYEADVDNLNDIIWGVTFIHLNVYNKSDTLEIERINEKTLDDFYSIRDHKI